MTSSFPARQGHAFSPGADDMPQGEKVGQFSAPRKRYVRKDPANRALQANQPLEHDSDVRRRVHRFRKAYLFSRCSYFAGLQHHRKTAPTSFEGPFGEVVRATGPMAKANPFRFSTKYQDDETDLVYYGYRYYSPGMGRWMNQDPLGEDGGENIYAAIQSDCIDDFDPVGLAACKSNYKWIVHPPMRDRDLLSEQTITVTTTMRVGQDSKVVTRPITLPVSGSRYGLTMTEPSLVAGDCCCASSAGYKPSFQLIVHSQIYLLDKRSSAWGADRIDSGDPSVDDYWHHSPRWYRRHLVMNHEEKHQADGKKNYEIWKSELQSAENNSFSSRSVCLQFVGQELYRTWGTFQMDEQLDADKLHSGGRL